MQAAYSLAEVARKAAELLMRYPWKLWFWGDSIGLEGLLDASALTGNERYADYVYGLLKAWIARRHAPGRFEYTAAGVALLRVYERTRDSALLKPALDHAEYLAAFRRTESGAYVRYEDAAIELPPELPADHPECARWALGARSVSDGGPCVFVDNMHFDGPFFAGLYRVTGEHRFRVLAVENILPSIELLFDRDSGLFHHFWQERTRRPNGVLWGRGNGWAMLGLMHTLALLPPSDPACPAILRVVQQQATALAALQDPSGDWHTVLDDPGSYLETSIAAFVVDGFSMGLRRGWLPETFRSTADRALAALLSHVEPDGKLSGVSYETFPSTRPEHYRQMPRNAVVPWGQGPLLTALLSHQRLIGAHT